jgi:hypothetical protein
VAGFAGWSVLQIAGGILTSGTSQLEKETSMSDQVIAARLGMGMGGASEALKRAKKASTQDEKIENLTKAMEILIAHLEHLESEKRTNEMNQQMGNI